MSNCIFCGSTEATEKVVFPETFTAYQMLQAGEYACKRCHAMFTTPKYRRKNFMVKNNFQEIDNPLSFLSNMPEPPFTLYLTAKKRKHGWINAVQNPVLSTRRFILCVDEDKIFFEREHFEELLRFFEGLWRRQIPKGVLLNGYPVAGLIRKFKISRKECLQLQKWQFDRLWRFIVTFKRSEPKMEELKN